MTSLANDGSGTLSAALLSARRLRGTATEPPAGAARLLHDAARLWLGQWQLWEQRRAGPQTADGDLDLVSPDSLGQLREEIVSTAKALATDIASVVLGAHAGKIDVAAGSTAWSAQCSWTTCGDLLPALERAHKCLRKRDRLHFEGHCVKVVVNVINHAERASDLPLAKGLIEALLCAYASSLQHYGSKNSSRGGGDAGDAGDDTSEAKSEFNLLSWLCYNIPSAALDNISAASNADDPTFNDLRERILCIAKDVVFSRQHLPTSPQHCNGKVTLLRRKYGRDVTRELVHAIATWKKLKPPKVMQGQSSCAARTCSGTMV
jgi:hypothetical protein